MNKIKVIFGRKNSCSEHIFKKTSLICDSGDAFGAQHIPLHQETHVYWLSTIYTRAKGLCWLNNKVGILCQHINGDLNLKCHLWHGCAVTRHTPAGKPRATAWGRRAWKYESIRSWAGRCAGLLSESEKGSVWLLWSSAFFFITPRQIEYRTKIESSPVLSGEVSLQAVLFVLSQDPQRGVWCNFLDKCFKV